MTIDKLFNKKYRYFYYMNKYFQLRKYFHIIKHIRFGP